MMDEEFICLNCGYKVSKLNYTARDHCPNCLYSRHVDIMPGDRMNECCGLMKPIGISFKDMHYRKDIGIKKYKNTYKIIYKCLKCNQIHKNIMADDDNYDLVVKLSVIS